MGRSKQGKRNQKHEALAKCRKEEKTEQARTMARADGDLWLDGSEGQAVLPLLSKHLQIVPV